MKFLYIGLVFSLLHTVVHAQQDSIQVNKAIAAVQRAHAPDKRSVYFHTTISGDSVLLETSSPAAKQAFETELGRITNRKLKTVLLPVVQLGGQVYGVANLSVSNNRVNPQNAAEMATQMLLGTPVEVLKKQGGFYLVRTPDGYLSWTDGTAVKLMDAVEFEYWKRSAKIIFMPEYGHVLSAPNKNAGRVSDVVSGSILRVTGSKNGFYQVQFPDRRMGYLPKKQAVFFNEWLSHIKPDPENILRSAQTLLGVPYLWGGTSVKGVDCSGFTKTAYFLNGIIIPRDASQQALVGEVVDIMENDNVSVEKCLKNLQPGDLLFFSAAKRRGVNGGRVTHTAIYMGEGQFIQSAGMVKINNIRQDAANYDSQTTSIVGARRILSSIGQPEITRVAAHPWYNSK